MAVRRLAAEGELLVRDRRERHPMERGYAVRRDRGAVLRRRVADVALELPTRMDLRRAAHVPVARDLREDRCGSDRGAFRVAVDDRLLLEPERPHAEAVDEADGVGARHAAERRAERLEVRSVQPARVDAAGAAHDDGGLRRGAQDERIQLLPAGFVVLLRVVEACE